MKSLSSKQAKAHAISPRVKQIVFARDHERCVNCGRPGNPNAHFVPRSKGGLGTEQNILTLCQECHHKFDFGTKEEREGMREFFKDYLMSKYPEWDEEKLIYHKGVLK